MDEDDPLSQPGMAAETSVTPPFPPNTFASLRPQMKTPLSSYLHIAENELQRLKTMTCLGQVWSLQQAPPLPFTPSLSVHLKFLQVCHAAVQDKKKTILIQPGQFSACCAGLQRQSNGRQVDASIQLPEGVEKGLREQAPSQNTASGGDGRPGERQILGNA